MARKNRILKAIRISSEMDDSINDISSKLEIQKQDLIRFLLNRAISQLKFDANKAGGYDKLEITIRQH